jgi:hypothetical protein
MKINEAILKLRSEMSSETISSESANMYKQNESTILYWLLFKRTPTQPDKQLLNTLKKILSADDWKLDKQ